MADITLSIASPQASGGAYFRYRYRELPAGSFTAYATAPVNTNTIALTGLNAGSSYLIEIQFVMADGTQCPFVTKTFDVPSNDDCVEATAELVPNGDNYLLEISWYYASSPVVPNPCGYIVQYQLQGSTQPPVQFIYNTLPPSPLQYPVVPGTYDVKIFKNLCNGSAILCWEDEVTTPVEECTGSVYTVELLFNGGNFILKITAIQSTPMTTGYSVIHQQINYTGSGTPDAGGQTTHTGTPTSTTMVIPIQPATAGVDTIYYRGSIQDRCGVQKFEVSLVIT